MPITILDYVKSRAGEKDTYTPEDFYSNGVDMLGGCQRCEATIAAYNAYPSTSGYWRCADCIGNDGFTTVGEFTSYESRTGRAITWLVRLRQLQAGGLDFQSALAQANAEADHSDHEDEHAAGDIPASCPECAGNVKEIRDRTFECGDCGARWMA